MVEESKQVNNGAQVPKDDEEEEQQQILANRALFAQTLTFNVIGRYDPKLSNLLLTQANSQIYEYDLDSGEWLKLPFRGPLAIYSRSGYEDDDGYHAGLIVLNKEKVENFSIGIMSVKNSAKLDKGEMKVEDIESLTVIKSTDGKTYGIWVQDDKESLYNLLVTLIQDETTHPQSE